MNRPSLPPPHTARWRFIGVAGVIGLFLLAWLPFLGASFQFDDFNVIVDTRRVHSLAAWWQDLGGLRPWLKLSYTLNWISGWGVTGFRATNLLIHLGCVWAVWRLAQFWPLPAALAAERVRIAFLAAALFALHPLHTEAVTYLCGRSTSLMSLCWLWACVCYLQGRQNAYWRLVSGGLWLLAIGIKEVALLWPLALLVLEIAMPQAGAWRRLWPFLLLLVAGLLALCFHPAYDRLLGFALDIRDTSSQLRGQVLALGYLGQKFVWPTHLSIDPDWAWPSHWHPGLVLGAATLLSLWLAAGWQRRRWPWLTLTVFWVTVALLPTNSLMPRLDLVNERQAYLADAVLCWAAALGLIWISRNCGEHGCRLAGSALCGTLAVLTLMRNADYATETTLWQATVRTSPANPRAWNNLGFALEQTGQRQAAIAAYAEALRLRPDYRIAQANWRRLQAPH